MKKTVSGAHQKLDEIRILIEEQGDRIFSILELLPVAMCVTDQYGNFFAVNEQYCRVYGYATDELVGQHFTKVVPEAKREILQKLHDEFIKQKKELQGQWDVEGKDKRLIKILVSAAYVQDHDGKPYKVTFLVEMIKQKDMDKGLDKTIALLAQDDEVLMDTNLFYKLDISGELDVKDLLGLSGEAPKKYSQQQLPKNFDQQALSVIDIYNGLMEMERRIFVLERKRLDLGNMIQNILSDLSDLYEEKNIRCATFFDHAHTDPWQSLPFDGDKIYLELMFQTMFFYIASSSVQGSELRIHVRLSSALISIEIEHTYGSEKSIDQKALKRLKHLSFLVVREHRGDVTFSNTREGHRKVTLVLPQSA
jgi:PAS domain S-box-containing protein